MSRVHFHMPPELAQCNSVPEASTVCLVCLMVARGAQLEYQRKTWEPYISDGQDAQKWFAYDTGETVDIRQAVVMGISDMLPASGLIPVCWDHLAGITIRSAPAAPLLHANGALPPEAFRNGGKRR